MANLYSRWRTLIPRATPIPGRTPISGANPYSQASPYYNYPPSKVTTPYSPQATESVARRPEAAPHQKPRARARPALWASVARPPPGRPTRVFGQGACAQAALVARADPMGFGRGVVELHVAGCLLERLPCCSPWATAITKRQPATAIAQQQQL